MSSLPDCDDHAVSLETQYEIDRRCLKFEDAWRNQERPAIEDYLCDFDSASRRSLLQELLAVEWAYRRDQKELINLESYCNRFPNDASMVAALYGRQCQRSEIGLPQVGDAVANYQLIERVGQGAFGVVYRAYDEQLDRTVAIKLSWAAGIHPARRLIEEATIAAALRHPGIAAIYHAGQTPEGRSFIVMEYVDGVALGTWLVAVKHSAKIIARVFAEIAVAAHYAHRRGVIHRDLKPPNILVDNENRPHILDFGLALRDVAAVHARGEVAGSPAYMAPEQVRGESHRLDGRADIWAIGVMLYEALTGTPPFRGGGTEELGDEILHRAPRPLRQICDQVPEELERICLRCLAKDPTQRYATGADLARDLRRWATGRPDPLRRWIVALPAMTMAAAGAGVTWSLSGFGPAAPSSLEAHLELFVWRRGRWRHLTDAGTVPLLGGDQVRTRIRLNQAAFIYLVWIDTAGRAIPMYPWRNGRFDEPIPAHEARQILRLPESPAADVWVMGAQGAGIESLLLLAGHDPLPETAGLQSLLSDLPLVDSDEPEVLLWFDDGALSGIRVPDRRGPDLTRSSSAPDGLLRCHRVIAERLRPLFPLIHAVSFSFRGGATSQTKPAALAEEA